MNNLINQSSYSDFIVNHVIFELILELSSIIQIALKIHVNLFILLPPTKDPIRKV